MNDRLPDVARGESACASMSLDRVGMADVALVFSHREAGVIEMPLQARADIAVNLPRDSTRGIHMSRLFRLLDDSARTVPVSPHSLAGLLEAMLASHEDCRATHADLNLRFDLPCRRPALLSAGMAGWRNYPVRVSARREAGRFDLWLTVEVLYSSTCPCSAALSRQSLQDAFAQDFAGEARPTANAVMAWIAERGSLATPHSQRSCARVTVAVDAQQTDFGIMALIDRVEDALGTPVQTAVRRTDEQAFARLNGQNLMYVEDAVRRIHTAVCALHGRAHTQVRHHESLHAHDALAELDTLGAPVRGLSWW